jgi:DNA-binding response OmpR family regulator
MDHLIVLADVLNNEWTDLTVMLTGHGYGILAARSQEDVMALMLKEDSRLALIDLELCGGDNRFFRSLKATMPDASIFVVSSRPFHPELKDAMAHHICACFRKPVDSEELLFWLKAVSRRPGARDPTDSHCHEDPV